MLGFSDIMGSRSEQDGCYMKTALKLLQILDAPVSSFSVNTFPRFGFHLFTRERMVEMYDGCVPIKTGKK